MAKAHYSYGAAFHRYALASGQASARPIVSALQAAFPIRSVLDAGCSVGSWLRVWNEFGVSDIWGLDGTSVRAEELEIDPARFQVLDLAQPFNLHRSFDLVQCLEVAEHLPPERAESLVQDLVAHSPRILFSAAAPGQGGEHHLNERPYEFWRDLFAAQGYVLIDALRGLLKRRREVSPWYRYNLLLFVDRSEIPSLPNGWASRALPPPMPVPDVSPWAYRLRKAVVRLLPRRWVDALSRWGSTLS